MDFRTTMELTSNEKELGENNQFGVDMQIVKVEEDFEIPEEVKGIDITDMLRVSDGFAPGTSSFTELNVQEYMVDGLQGYKYCYISHVLEKSIFTCNTCFFTTQCVKKAALHFINNESNAGKVFISMNLVNSKLKCNKCSFSTENETDAVLHRLGHIFKGILNCFMCNYSTSDDIELKLHIIAHLDVRGLLENVQDETIASKSVMCPTCNVTHANIHELTQHFSRKHAHKRFVCIFCHESFYYKTDIEYHLKKHTEKNSNLVSGSKVFKCEYCPFTDILMRLVKEHTLTEHTDLKQYFECHLCKNLFKTKRILEKHIAIKHEGNIMECGKCTYKTRYRSSFAKHMEYHMGKPLDLCHICGFQTNNERSMEKHVFNHNTEKNVQCKQCDFKCRNLSQLSRHMVVHSEERRFSCHICSYHSKTAHYLKKHIRTHVAVRPINCTICNYTCLNQIALTKHLVIHSTKREYFSCNECDRKYLSKVNLKRHQATHSVSKMLSCTYCSKPFSSLKGLEKHTRLHTGEGLMYCFECNYNTTNKGNFIKHVTVTCSKAKDEYKMQCFKCDYTSGHRSNFITHVGKCTGKKQVAKSSSTKKKRKLT